MAMPCHVNRKTKRRLNLR